MTDTAAIIGAGRLGAAVARRLPADTRIIISDTETEKGRRLAEAVNGTFVPDLAGMGQADLIILALPTPVIKGTVETLLGLAKKGAIILNMATSAQLEPELKQRNPAITVMDAKLIGSARSIENGEPGLVVIDCSNPEQGSRVQQLLRGLCQVEYGDADLVGKISRICSIEAIKAAVAVRKQLRALHVPEEWINIAITSACAGTMQAYVNNDIGPFSQQIARELELAD